MNKSLLSVLPLLLDVLQLPARHLLQLLRRHPQAQLRIYLHPLLLAQKTLIRSIEIAVGVHLVIAEQTFGRIAEGTFHFSLQLDILEIVAFEAIEAEAVRALATGQYL